MRFANWSGRSDDNASSGDAAISRGGPAIGSGDFASTLERQLSHAKAHLHRTVGDQVDQVMLVQKGQEGG